MISEKEADKLYLLIEDLIRAIDDGNPFHSNASQVLDEYILSLTKLDEDLLECNDEKCNTLPK